MAAAAMGGTSGTIVFLGPSLPRDAAAQILTADYRPPARKGDIYAVLTSAVRRIILVDGIFHSGPSVWQREILAALDEGIEVFGASSMGALRAAELHPFGMVGCGTVFEWFRSGWLDGDDEVALRHGPEDLGYRALSEPLVNIRATLRRAVHCGEISQAEHDDLVLAMKRTHYAERSYRAVAHCPVVQAWPEERRARIAAFLASRAVDVKADDARGVLAFCARTPARAGDGDVGDRRSPVLPGGVDPWSAEFRHVALGYRALGGRRAVPWAAARRAVCGPPARWHRALVRATVAWCVLDLARLRGVACPDAEVARFAAGWRRAARVRDAVRWAHARGLTRREHAEVLRRRAFLRWLRAAGPAGIGAAWDREAAAGLHRLLRARSGLRADDSAFVAGWMAAHGLACPRAERARLLAAWELDTAARRGAAARRLGLSPARLAAALDQRIAAEWLVGAGRSELGRAGELETAAVLESQFAMSAAALRALARGATP
jgi:hypothetical protein